MPDLKPQGYRVYLIEKDRALLQTAAAKLEEKETKLLSLIIHAGLAALSENGNTYHAPLRFALKDDSNRWNEPAPKTHYHKR